MYQGSQGENMEMKMVMEKLLKSLRVYKIHLKSWIFLNSYGNLQILPLMFDGFCLFCPH